MDQLLKAFAFQQQLPPCGRSMLIKNKIKYNKAKHTHGDGTGDTHRPVLRLHRRGPSASAG